MLDKILEKEISENGIIHIFQETTELYTVSKKKELIQD